MCTKLVTNRFNWWFSKALFGILEEREREGLWRVENILKIGGKEFTFFERVIF